MARVDDLVVDLQTTGPALRARLALEGRLYDLRLVINSRDRLWYLDLAESDGSPVLVGVRVVEGVALWTPGDPRLPPGQLYAEDARGLGEAPSRDAWGVWARLYYRPASVVEAARGTADEVF